MRQMKQHQRKSYGGQSFTDVGVSHLHAASVDSASPPSLITTSNEELDLVLNHHLLHVIHLLKVQILTVIMLIENCSQTLDTCIGGPLYNKPMLTVYQLTTEAAHLRAMLHLLAGMPHLPNIANGQLFFEVS